MVAEWIGVVIAAIGLPFAIAQGLEVSRRRKRRAEEPADTTPASTPKFALAWEPTTIETTHQKYWDAVFTITYLSGPELAGNIKLMITDGGVADFQLASSANADRITREALVRVLSPGTSKELRVRLWRRKGTLCMRATDADGTWSNELRAPFHVP